MNRTALVKYSLVIALMLSMLAMQIPAFAQIADDIGSGIVMKVDKEVLGKDERLVQYTISNYTGKDVYFGLEYGIEAYKGGKWQTVPTKEELMWPMLAVILKSKGFEFQRADLSLFNSDWKDEKYRIVKNIEGKAYYAEFKFEGNSANPNAVQIPAEDIPASKNVSMTTTYPVYFQDVTAFDLVMKNNSKRTYTFGLTYELYKYKDGKLTSIPTFQISNMILLSLKPGETYVGKIDLSGVKLSEGEYRIVRNVNCDKRGSKPERAVASFKIGSSKITADKPHGFTKLELLPQGYSFEDAKRELAYVSENSGETNKLVLSDFVTRVTNGIPSYVRVVTATVEGDMLITDIEYKYSHALGRGYFIVERDTSRDSYRDMSSAWKLSRETYSFMSTAKIGREKKIVFSNYPSFSAQAPKGCSEYQLLCPMYKDDAKAVAVAAKLAAKNTAKEKVAAIAVSDNDKDVALISKNRKSITLNGEKISANKLKTFSQIRWVNYNQLEITGKDVKGEEYKITYDRSIKGFVGGEDESLIVCYTDGNG